MQYQFLANVLFSDPKDVETLLNEIEKIKSKSFKPSSPTPIPSDSVSEAFRCYHDETPPSPCDFLVAVDFSNAIPVTHKDIDLL